MSATRSLEERLLEMEKKEQASREKAKRYAEKKKVLQQRQAENERKKRTHRLCQIGGNAPLTPFGGRSCRPFIKSLRDWAALAEQLNPYLADRLRKMNSRN